MDNENEKPKRGRPRKRQMPQIAIRLATDQIADLDELVDASRGRHNRSDLIRAAIDEFLERRKGQ